MNHSAPKARPNGRTIFKWKHTIAVVLGAPIFLALNMGLFWALDRPVEAPPPPPQERHRGIAPDIDERIEDTQISVLRKESLERALDNLSEAYMFFWPGVVGRSTDYLTYKLPLPAAVGVFDVETVMSNRRFLKVFDELSHLPKPKAAALINREIERTLPVYRKLVDADLELKKESIRAGAEPRPGGGFVVEPQGKNPTWTGMRFKLLALVLLAGNLELEDCHATVLKVGKTASADYAKFCRKDLYNFFSGYCLITAESLYNRQILGTGLLGTSGELVAARPAGVGLNTQDLTHFDAKATRYDLHGRIGAEPIDFSKGRITVRWITEIDDEIFERILAGAEREKK